MYVIKVGEYYVKSVEMIERLDGSYIVGDIELSKELMRGFNEGYAKLIGDKLNVIPIEMTEEVTNEK